MIRELQTRLKETSRKTMPNIPAGEKPSSGNKNPDKYILIPGQNGVKVISGYATT